MYTDQKCGRGIAPDGSGSANTCMTDPPLSGASPLPQLVAFQVGVRRGPGGWSTGSDPTGKALLLCRNGCTPINMWEGACPLPQLIAFQVGVRRAQGIGRQVVIQQAKPSCCAGTGVRRSKCGRGLAPDGGLSAKTCLTDPPLSGACPLPHWVVFQVGVRRGPGGWSAGSDPTGKALLLCRKGCTPIKMWEGACPRWQCVSQYIPD